MPKATLKKQKSSSPRERDPNVRRAGSKVTPRNSPRMETIQVEAYQETRDDIASLPAWEYAQLQTGILDILRKRTQKDRPTLMDLLTILTQTDFIKIEEMNSVCNIFEVEN
jgi:hypothetical protein